MATSTERTAKLEASIEAQAKKLAELKAKKAKIDARGRYKEKAEERKKETRRLVLLGAFLKSRMDASEETKAKNMTGLDGFLKRPEERALFDLPVNS
ncbi:MAG: mobilization protein [Pedobacter sp.]|nr:MAG: mobilization protein [Pedobacter sp.]